MKTGFPNLMPNYFPNMNVEIISIILLISTMDIFVAGPKIDRLKLSLGILRQTAKLVYGSTLSIKLSMFPQKISIFATLHCSFFSKSCKFKYYYNATSCKECQAQTLHKVTRPDKREKLWATENSAKEG